MRKYKFECGCISEGFARVRVKPTYYQYRVCKTHKKKIISGIFTCPTCGVDFESNAQGPATRYCPKCKPAHQRSVILKGRAKAKSTEYKKKIREERKTQKKQNSIAGKMQPPRKSDCFFYNDCLTPPKGKLLKNSTACVKCRKYKKSAPFDPVDFAIQKLTVWDMGI